MRKKLYDVIRLPQLGLMAVSSVLFAAGFFMLSTAQKPVQHRNLINDIVVSGGVSPTIAEKVAVDCSREPCFALSFDDGPNPETTPIMLDVLKKHDVQATFFVVGSRVPGNEAIVKEMHDNGNEIGNHTWSHHNMKQMNGRQIRSEVQKTQMAVMRSGVPAPHLLRPPYGEFDIFANSQTSMAIARWNVDPEDWKEPDPRVIADKIIAQARPGGVIVLHDVHAQTVQAVDMASPVLKQRFRLVTISQMFNLRPGQRGEFFGR